MHSYKYLIVGSGMTGHAAAQAIRELDAKGTLGMIGDEPHRPYARPPLSKKLWSGKPEESIWLDEVKGLELQSGRRAVTLDTRARRVTDDRGESYEYQKLLLATGGTPRRLPFGGERIVYFRKLDDYRALRALTAEQKRVVVIGGGFIGSEIAASLASNGKQVTMVFPEDGIGARVFPADHAEFLNGYYREKGVVVRPRESITGVSERGLVTKAGEEIAADAIVAGIGIVPNTALAESAGIAVEDGILVDEGLRAGAPDVFAAGDVARFPSVVLGRRVRVEHEDNAVTMGREAGRAMAGAAVTWTHVPLFYSDLFELGYEAVGDLDSRHETFADWKDPHKEGVIHYLRDGRVCGVLLWNTWGQVDNARALMAEPGPFKREDLAGRLPR